MKAYQVFFIKSLERKKLLIPEPAFHCLFEQKKENLLSLWRGGTNPLLAIFETRPLAKRTIDRTIKYSKHKIMDFIIKEVEVLDRKDWIKFNNQLLKQEQRISKFEKKIK